MKQYAFYQGEELIMIGTAKECAKELNIKVETVYFYASESYAKRIKRPSSRIAVVLSNDEEEYI